MPWLLRLTRFLSRCWVLDFPEIENALAAGAPNRPFADQWKESDGARAMWFLGESFGRHLLDSSGSIGNFGQSHASAMRALVEAGADFSPQIPPCMIKNTLRPSQAA